MENKIIYALANPVRLKLLCCISKKSANVEELIANCGLAQSAVSQHLTKLRLAGLVKTSRRGRYIYYTLTSKKTGIIAKSINEFTKEMCS